MHLSGSPFDYVIAFLGGLSVSLSPCVYPLIPVSIGVIAAQAGASRLKGFVLSLVYVSGIALVYSFLGLAAVLSGRMFGVISAHPLTYILVGSVIILFGISMFDLVKIPSFNLIRLIRLPFLNQRRYLSSFLLGLSSGFVIGPCLTPVLGSILIYLATTKNILYGVTLLVSFSYGMGLILILAGTSSSFLTALPQSGKWLVYLRRITAVIIIAVGVYFLFSGIRGLI